MKKTKLILVYVILVVIAWTHTGCFGSFQLTRKAWEFNKNVGGKLAQEGVFLLMCIVPVYEAFSFIDVIILNTIEFWSGKNPVAMKTGEIQTKTLAIKGQTYKVTAVPNKFIIEKKSANGYIMLGTLEYKNNSWYSNTNNREHKLIGYNAKGQVEVYAKDNKVYKMDKSLASATLLQNMVNNEAIASR